MNIIITGGSKGMGRAIAEAFAAANYNLFLCSRNETELNKTADEICNQYSGCSVQIKAADVSNANGAESLATWVLEKTSSKIDVLVNNAGQFIPGSVYNEEEGSLEKMLAVNLYSAYNLTRNLIQAMISAKHGHIFNICSIAALKAYANGGSYSISKYALNGFSKNLREEMKPFNIKVTTVYPGATMSDSWKGSGVEESRIMNVNDVAKMIFAAAHLSPQAVIEEILLRPQLGDL